MYQVVTEVRIDGKREMDSVFHKVYVHKGAAERNASRSTLTTKTDDGKVMEIKTYVRGFLNPVGRKEAKEAYCHGKRIWIDGKYGQEKIRSSGEYGSHAPAEELFYRSVMHHDGYYHQYNGNYYIEYEK